MAQKRAICTIIAKNYISAARTLAQSFLAHHPNYKCYVLIIDGAEDYVNPSDECFEIVDLINLGIPNLPAFCFKYSVTELCTAVKADLLEYLIREKSVNELLYIDPDILVTNSLNNVYEKLGVYDIALTPHLDADYPNDGLLPNDGYILRAGIFNLGFIGINSSENAKFFLNWWKSKLREKCVVDLLNGYFVDQKFVDLVPILFENFYIEKEVGYNVAYWNLHSRSVSRSDGIWKCNDGPLYFFHFSGYRPETPETMVSYIPNSKARYRLLDRPDLQPLFSEYKNQLIKNGHNQTSVWPYSYGSFSTGENIPYELRVLYRNFPEWERYGDPFESAALKRRALIIRMAKRSYASSMFMGLAHRYGFGLRRIYKRWIEG